MEYINESLLNRGTMNGIYGAVIHNDYGRMTPKQYVAWLKTRNLELGIAHYYGNRNQMVRVVDTNKVAWHTASEEGNGHYIGYEVCESLSASDADFLANEEAVFKQVAEDFKFYGITPNRNTVRLHKEFTSTSCPHRSWELHGRELNAVKDYFISRIKAHMASIVGTPTPTPTPVAKPTPVVLQKQVVKPTNKWVAESGTFIPSFAINVRSGASTASPVVATYNKGESVRYDSYYNDGHFVWIHYKSYRGHDRYMVCRENGTAWGSFS